MGESGDSIVSDHGQSRDLFPGSATIRKDSLEQGRTVLGKFLATLGALVFTAAANALHGRLHRAEQPGGWRRCISGRRSYVS